MFKDIALPLPLPLIYIKVLLLSYSLYTHAGRLPEGCFLKVRAMAVGILGWLMVQEKHKKHIGW